MSFIVPYYRSLTIYGELCNLKNDISLLHPDVLAILHHLSKEAGQILELGPYLGGSTIAMARGLTETHSDTRIISVELGGASGRAPEQDHPQYGTEDILGQLHRNLERYQVADLVHVVQGNSRDPSVVHMVRRCLAGERIGLMFIDTDGEVAEDFALYRDHLKARAYLVVDDFFSPGAPEKAVSTRLALADLQQARVVECYGIYGWGTWVGRLLL